MAVAPAEQVLHADREAAAQPLEKREDEVREGPACTLQRCQLSSSSSLIKLSSRHPPTKPMSTCAEACAHVVMGLFVCLSSPENREMRVRRVSHLLEYRMRGVYSCRV